MSNDLISRKALINILKGIDKDGLLTINQIIDFIEDQPTAFDKEKVIDELQKPDPIIRTFIGKSFTTIDRAIEIVEKGGIE